MGRIREDFMKKKGIAAGVEKLEEVLTGECEDGARRWNPEQEEEDTVESGLGGRWVLSNEKDQQ